MNYILVNKETEKKQTKLKITDHDTHKFPEYFSQEPVCFIFERLKASSNDTYLITSHQLNLQAPCLVFFSLLKRKCISTCLILKRFFILEVFLKTL